MQLCSEKRTYFGGTLMPLFLIFSRELRCCSNASRRLAGAYRIQHIQTLHTGTTNHRISPYTTAVDSSVLALQHCITLKFKVTWDKN